MTTWVQLAGELIRLVVAVVLEFLIEKAAARERGEAYALSKERFRVIAERSLNKLRDEARQDHAQAISVEDALEDAAKKK